MTHHASKILVFLAGLSVALWIGIGYVGSNPLGAVVVLVIAAFYLLGAVELYRYGRATAGLGNAIDGLQTTPPALDDWLGRVPAGLRQAVRLRVEGERAPLPAPTLAPYLVGLLVLLGMLGTLLGMMATLRGTGLALENAGDLGAVQNSLAAPVKGLAFAFGTSIAGVAASAMLGLLAALVRRERVAAVQRLDAKIATLLHPFSRGWQREQAFALLQQQAGQMPVLVERLQTMIDTLQARDAALAERLQAGQQAFHAQAESAYKTLASDVGQALKDSVGESARSVGTALQPVVQATMQAVAAEAAGLHENVAAAVRRQLDGVSAGLEAATARVAGQWDAALERQQQAADVQSEALRQALEGFTSGFEQRSAALVDAVADAGKPARPRPTRAASTRWRAGKRRMPTWSPASSRPCRRRRMGSAGKPRRCWPRSAMRRTSASPHWKPATGSVWLRGAMLSTPWPARSASVGSRPANRPPVTSRRCPRPWPDRRRRRSRRLPGNGRRWRPSAMGSARRPARGWNSLRSRKPHCSRCRRPATPRALPNGTRPSIR